MIREVYINDQLIDIEADNTAGYIFSSPIFRDISKIMSNRTTTYKIPITTKNVAIFGLANNPDVDAVAPYREHKFLEIRDGLTFIQGVCFLLKTSDKDLELAVFWGNAEKLQSLKEKKLRDLNFSLQDYIDDRGNEIEGFRYLYWNEKSSFLGANDERKSGFLKIDFGQGVEDMNYIHPCVNIQYILDLIKSSTKVKIDYPARFVNEFASKWFPLTSKNPNSLTWDSIKYRTIGYPDNVDNYGKQNYSILNFSNTSDNILEVKYGGDCIKAKEGATVEFIPMLRFKALPGLPTGNYAMKMYLGQGWAGEVYSEHIVDVVNGIANFPMPTLSFKASKTEEIYIKVAVRKGGESNWQHLKDKFVLDKEYSMAGSPIYVKYDEVQFTDKFPISPNLPDLSVLDFLKTIMSMYGLFTYHSFRTDPDTVKFVSIGDMYDYKRKETNDDGIMAYDWTNKLLMLNSQSRMKIEYTYGDYARKNKFKYKNDKDVTTNVDGYLEVDNEQLLREKDLIEIPYSPSENTADEFDNKYAKIPLYDADGKYSSSGIRILSEGRYRVYNEDGSLKVTYKSASFDDSLYFSGNEGLIVKHYSDYQRVLKHPVVIECAVYLSDLELHLFREINPIYIDGVYYMPITVTVQTNGVANCKLIKMPYKPMP